MDTNLVFDENYGTLTRTELRLFRKHNVSPADYFGIIMAGYTGNEVAELIKANLHGSTFYMPFPLPESKYGPITDEDIATLGPDYLADRV